MTDTTAPKCEDCEQGYNKGQSCFSLRTGFVRAKLNREDTADCGPTARYFEAKKNDE